jgi:phage terminase Nu1 subunit (DNA packaging protein)
MANLPEQWSITTADLATLLGVTSRVFGHWRRDHGFPEQIKRGLYDLREIAQWWMRVWKEARAHTAQADEDRLLKAKADKAEMEVREKRREVIPRDEVDRAFRQMITEARGLLVNVPARCIQAISPEGRYRREEVEAIIKEQVDLALEALARGEDFDGTDKEESDGD